MRKQPFIPVFAILFFIFLSLSSKNAIAQEAEAATSSPSSSIISYDLPYPGMLPDNPFYKLKVLRDRIIAKFIGNPEEKVNFYLRLADKGILAAAMLIDKHNVSLAQSTALKAENNITTLVGELYALPYQPSPDLINKLKTASLKHQEVLSSLLPRVSEGEKKTFETVIDFSKRNSQTIQDYRFEK